MTNTIQITGNLAGDPNLTFTQSGKAVCNATVCDTPRKFNKETQQWEDSGPTLFMRFSLWDEDAELAAETLSKGQKVTVTGRLVARSYEKDGATVNVTECQASSVAPHARRGQAQRGNGAQSAQSGSDRRTTPPEGDPWATSQPGREKSWDNSEPPF